MDIRSSDITYFCLHLQKFLVGSHISLSFHSFHVFVDRPIVECETVFCGPTVIMWSCNTFQTFKHVSNVSERRIGGLFP